MIVHEIITINKIFNIRFKSDLKIEILLWGNNQNISCSILTWLGKTNTFSHLLESLRSRTIIKIIIKKLDDDY